MGPKKRPSGRSRNENLVPDGDLPYYRAATVAGLRQQLDDENLDTDGLKYDLYLRLVNKGFRLYTDDRDSDDEDSSGTSSDTDSDSEDDNGGRKPPPKAGNKRRRDSSSDEDGSDNPSDNPSDDGGDGPDPGPPPRMRRRIALPAELQIPLIESLHPAALWNLILTAPEDYLNGEPAGGVNALILEARSHYRFDHPPPQPPAPAPPQDDGQDNGGDDNGGDNNGGDNNGGDNNGNDNNDDNNSNDDNNHDQNDDVPHPMSLLEWVGSRALNESRFRRANRNRILRVLDAYLQVYGPDNPPEPAANERDGILYFFRQRGNPPLPGMIPIPPLSEAASDRDPVAAMAAQLLILRGADVNQIVRNRRPLDYALPELHADINSARGLQIVFTLLGAGADVGLLRPATHQAAFQVLLDFDFFDGDRDNDQNPQVSWPRINNPLGLSIREFIADERSSYWDRVLLAMYVVWRGVIDYPLFV